MLSKYLTSIVNIIALSYLTYILYFKGTTKLNFILGNVILVIALVIIVMRIYLWNKTRKSSKGDDYKLINEVLKELEDEKKENLK